MSLLGKITGSDAAAKAARQAGQVQAAASREGIAETRRQFDVTQGMIQPQIEAGDLAREQQLRLLGLRGAGEQEAALGAFQQSPGQRFLQERAQRNLLQNASAIGGLGGGNVRSALVEQGVGFAQTDLQNQLAQLSGLSGSGQAATGAVGQLGAQQAGTTAQLLGQAGQAQASGLLGAAQAQQAGQQQLLGTLGGAGLGAAGLLGPTVGAGGGALLGLLSDKNMKTDIHDLDLKACYNAVMEMPLKSWRYIKEAGLGDCLNLGPMAQDAPEMIKLEGQEMLDLHNELMMIAGALQYIKRLN